MDGIKLTDHLLECKKHHKWVGPMTLISGAPSATESSGGTTRYVTLTLPQGRYRITGISGNLKVEASGGGENTCSVASELGTLLNTVTFTPGGQRNFSNTYNNEVTSLNVTATCRYGWGETSAKYTLTATITGYQYI